MNTERLVSIVNVLSEEVSIAGTVEQLASHLQQAINGPTEATQRR